MSAVVVLDTEALSLLTPERRHDPGRRRLMAHLEEAAAVITPRVARVEAITPRDARHADLNRLVRDAEEHPPLRDRGRSIADAAAGVRSRLGTGVAVVDALVGAVAAEVAAEVVEVITADTADLTAVADALDAPFHVVCVSFCKNTTRTPLLANMLTAAKEDSMLGADAGRLIRDLRRRSGLNQAQLAIRAGTTTSAISRLERGHVSPTVATLETLLICLGYRLDLQTLPFDTGIDPTQLQAVSAMTPTERLDHALASQRSLAGLVGAARE